MSQKSSGPPEALNMKRPLVRNRKKKYTRKSVLKMLAVMAASDKAGPSKPASDKDEGEVFLESGRTGRRNALADILSDHAIVSSSDLPGKLQGLTTEDKSQQQEDKSKQNEQQQQQQSKKS